MNAETTFTMFLPTDNLKDLETLDEYLILSSKTCVYSSGQYSVIAFTVLDETAESYDPETMLEVMGGLAVHEDGSHCFLILEQDLDEIERTFSWDGSANVLMSELLSVGDRCILLEKKKQKEKIEGDITVNVGSRENPIWKPLYEAGKELFEDNCLSYRLGDKVVVDIWWPFLIEDIGGFNIVVQKIPEVEPKQLQYPLATQQSHPNPFDPADDAYFDDYDDYDWLHMHRCGGRYSF